MKKNVRLKIVLGICLILVAPLISACVSVTRVYNVPSVDAGSVRIGIAWVEDTDAEFCTNIASAIEEAGGEPVFLDQVVDYDLEYENGRVSAKGVSPDDYLNTDYSEIIKRNTYRNSNAAEVAAGVDAVVFPGGEDISPMLLKDPEDWIGIEAEKDFNATRDVSDYLLMAYCIDKDLPTMGFCRGMQMMSVVSGASMIQDIPAFFEERNTVYHFEHRNEKNAADSYRDYAPHDITIIDTDSHLYDIFGCTTVKAVPSWHHQAVKGVDGTKLRVSSVCNTGGYDIIESVERTDKQFVVGYQFHPEAAIAKHNNAADNAGLFMDKEMALKTFRYFIGYIGEMESDLAA